MVVIQVTERMGKGKCIVWTQSFPLVDKKSEVRPGLGGSVLKQSNRDLKHDREALTTYVKHPLKNKFT